MHVLHVVVIREFFDSLEESDDLEDDMLDKAWGPGEMESRLGCQAKVADTDLVVEIQSTHWTYEEH